jgi:hypothetical protein
MRKYRVEIFVASLFFALLVAMLWSVLSVPAFPALPHFLLAACLVPPFVVIVSSLSARSGDTEQYAPREFAKILLSSVIGIVLALAAAALLNRDNFSKTFDLTERKVHTLSDESLRVIKGLEKKVEIVCIPELQRASRYCEDHAHLMTLFAQANPEKIAVGSVRMNDIVALKRIAPTGDRRLVVVMEGGQRSEIVGQVSESKLTNGIINLTRGKKTVYFLSGNGEPLLGYDTERNYSVLVEFLKKRGYEAKEYKIQDGELPVDAKVLVAGSPAQAYPAFVETMLRKFLARGGKLILSVNPYRELGLSRLLDDVGIKLDPLVLVGDGGVTPLGGQLAQVNPLRPPVALGEFSRVSEITSKLSLPYGVSDGARPISFESRDKGDFKVKATELAAAFAATAYSVSEAERNRISLDGPFNMKGGQLDPRKSFRVAYEIEISEPGELAAGIANGEKAKGDEKAEMIVMGFDLQAKYVQPEVSTQVEVPLLAIAKLHQDKDLVTVPTKDYTPKQFRMDRNPGGWLAMFAFFLPAGTVLMGLYIWMRRRSS